MDIDWCPCGIKTNGKGPYCSTRCRDSEYYSYSELIRLPQDYSNDDSSDSSSLFVPEHRRLSNSSSTSADCAAASSFHRRESRYSNSIMTASATKSAYTNNTSLFSNRSTRTVKGDLPLPMLKPRASTSTFPEKKRIVEWAIEASQFYPSRAHFTTTIESSSSPYNSAPVSDSSDVECDDSTSDGYEDEFVAEPLTASGSRAFKFPLSSKKLALPIVMNSNTLPARSGVLATNTGHPLTSPPTSSPSSTAAAGFKAASSPTSSPTIVPPVTSTTSSSSSPVETTQLFRNIFRRRSTETSVISSIASSSISQQQRIHHPGYTSSATMPLSVPTTSSSQALSGLAYASASTSLASTNTRSSPIPIIAKRRGGGRDVDGFSPNTDPPYTDVIFPRKIERPRRNTTMALVSGNGKGTTDSFIHRAADADADADAGRGRGRERVKSLAGGSGGSDESDYRNGLEIEDGRNKGTYAHLEHVQISRPVGQQLRSQQQRQHQHQQPQQTIAIERGAIWIPQAKRAGVQRGH